MSDQPHDDNDTTHPKDTQVDLFLLIGGSWPPAPKEPENPGYGSVRCTRTMQQPSHERVKSVNLIAHLAPEKKKTHSAKIEPSHCVRKPKMVHEPKKVETGILVDVSPSEGLNVPEELYDQPSLGTPRAARSPPPSPLNLQDDIGVGSLVEVATDLDQHYYGVVRWIGLIDETLTAGVELEQAVAGLGDGARGGARVFTCGAGRGLFVPLALCRPDARFRNHEPSPSRSEQPECPLVTGVVPPLNSLTELVGRSRGIQGHHNSCYLDATLFAMFTFTSVFDALLYRPAEPEDCSSYTEVQRVLREEIVNPLRRHGYVRADRVMKLRTLLDRLSTVQGLTSDEKDPEEFLNVLAQILRAEPYLKLSSGQEAFCYQLFVEKDESITLPTVQQLLEQSLTTSGVKFSEVPAILIIQMPRFGNTYKVYPRVLPSPVLDVTDLIEGLPRQCTVCGGLARWECGECAGRCGAGADSTAFCLPCLRVAHTHTRHTQAKPLSVNEEFANVLESCPVPRVYMELFAVLCIETSHYVAFVKAGAGDDAPWCLFDSMADRKGERDGYNIPTIWEVPETAGWVSERGGRALCNACPRDRQLPARAKRLLCDASLCLYRAPDIAMYR